MRIKKKKNLWDFPINFSLFFIFILRSFPINTRKKGIFLYFALLTLKRIIATQTSCFHLNQKFNRYFTISHLIYWNSSTLFFFFEFFPITNIQFRFFSFVWEYIQDHNAIQISLISWCFCFFSFSCWWWVLTLFSFVFTFFICFCYRQIWNWNWFLTDYWEFYHFYKSFGIFELQAFQSSNF